MATLSVMFPIDFLYRGAWQVPENVALEDGTTVLRYGELVGQVQALAAAFQQVDPLPGSRVGVCAHNTIDHAVVLLATLAAGKVWVPLNPRETASELDAKVDAARPGILVIGEDCAGKVTPRSQTLFVADATGRGTVAAAIARNSGKSPTWPGGLGRDDTQAIKFTGGSSGKPKGVLQPYRSWLVQAASQIHHLALGPGDKFLAAAPLTHGTSCYVLPILGAGGCLSMLKSASPPVILDALVTRAVSVTFLAPTTIYRMMAEPGATRTYPALRNLIYGGAAMRPAEIECARQIFGPKIATTYGQTEASQIITFMPPDAFGNADLLASVGQPSFLTAVSIRAPDGGELPRGEAGEIWVRGDLVMTGYLDRPDLTAETIVDGWLRTGDVGMFDERQFLFIKDRIRDVIISGGFNVYPSDVEAALGSHPAIMECVAFGQPDPMWGERVEAAVELHRGARATAEEILAHVKAAIGPVKTPKRLHIADSLPRSAVGKVLRREAKRLYSGPEGAP